MLYFLKIFIQMQKGRKTEQVECNLSIFPCHHVVSLFIVSDCFFSERGKSEKA